MTGRELSGETVTTHSSKRSIFSFFHIGDFTLNEVEEVDKVAGETGGMGVDRIVWRQG